MFIETVKHIIRHLNTEMFLIVIIRTNDLHS